MELGGDIFQDFLLLQDIFETNIMKLDETFQEAYRHVALTIFSFNIRVKRIGLRFGTGK